ncbi:MAG: ABC transporter permease subunit [Deltaproteobacteria bacterium]|nr:ABC transporter permease subunit [Deltaproteobacteria bacterium]MBI3391287.1 ABC transporter permease subunit [Deltaproteobacteria bacterium]
MPTTTTPTATTPATTAHPPVRSRFSWVDALLLLGLGALIAGLVALARRWEAPLRPTVDIDLSVWALPKYTLLSLARGVAAYILSLIFTLTYGTVAAYSRRAERVMIPVLDILQGIPVLGFLPGLVLGMVALFPHSNIGLELACIVMIFTGQVWNMTFAFYGALRAIPTELREAAQVYRFGWWKRFRTVEVPSAMIGLVWNSMMSMAGGWFFLTVNEAFTLGDRDFRLPGIGAYMSVAIERGDARAMAAAVVAMITMIVAVDQLLWRPALAWAQKFKVEETGTAQAPTSWALDLLRRSRVLPWIETQLRRIAMRLESRRAARSVPSLASPLSRQLWLQRGAGIAAAVGFGSLTLWGVTHLVRLLAALALHEWLRLLIALALTFLRTATALTLSALWAVPVGVWIGLSPKRVRMLQPLIQIAAAFPAPMIFPVVTLVILALGINFSWGCVVLMLLGAQWYVLFNVLAGASAMPQDLREAAEVYGLSRWARWRTLYLPAIFPSLVTGLITAAGGAWNASIVAEYVHYRDQTLIAPGLGSLITEATAAADFPLLAAGVLTMSLALVALNRTVWHRLYRLADDRFSLNR